MAFILQTTFPNAFSLMKMFDFFIKILLVFVSLCPIHNKATFS